MVDRYRCYGWDTRRGDMRREDDGNFVSYYDYAELEVEVERLTTLYESAVKGRADFRQAYRDARAEAVSRTGALEGQQEPPCTCHPDDNPPDPCAQKFAYSDCVAAAPEGQQEPVAVIVGHHADHGYRIEWLDSSAPVGTKLYSRPSEQAVTEAMVTTFLQESGRFRYLEERSRVRSALKAAMEEK